MNDKILRLIGLARRGGAVTYGTIGVLIEVKKANAKIVILACDLSEKTKKDFFRKWQNSINPNNNNEIFNYDFLNKKVDFFYNNIKVLEIPYTKEEIGYTIGTKPTGILSISDENFKKGILEVNSFENKEKNI